MIEEMIDHARASLRHHAADDIFAHQDRRERVEADQRLDIGVAHIGEQAPRSHAGVVDQPVDRPEPRARLAHEGRDGGDVGEVERGEAERARGGVRRRSLQRLAVATGDRDDAKTVARQAFGDGEAEAAAGAGDDDIIHGARAFPPR